MKVSQEFKRALEAEVKRLAKTTRATEQPAAYAGRLIRQLDQIPDLMDTASDLDYKVRSLERAIASEIGPRLTDKRLVQVVKDILRSLQTTASLASKIESELSSAYKNAKDLAKHIGT